jgi:hypothetical protein
MRAKDHWTAIAAIIAIVLIIVTVMCLSRRGPGASLGAEVTGKPIEGLIAQPSPPLVRGDTGRTSSGAGFSTSAPDTAPPTVRPLAGYTVANSIYAKAIDTRGLDRIELHYIASATGAFAPADVTLGQVVNGVRPCHGASTCEEVFMKQRPQELPAGYYLLKAYDKAGNMAQSPNYVRFYRVGDGYGVRTCDRIDRC